MALTASVGWYASDDGLVPAWSAPHRLVIGETTRLFMDFSPLTELVTNLDTISSQTVTVAPAGMTLANKAVNGTRIEADVTPTIAGRTYSVIFTATLSSGAVRVRTGSVRVPL